MLTPSVTAFGGDSSLREGAFLRLPVNLPLIRQAQQVIGADIEEFGNLNQARNFGIVSPVLIALITAQFYSTDYGHFPLFQTAFLSELSHSFRKNLHISS
jgi:hypothetical protein